MIYVDDHIWNFDLSQALDSISKWRRDYALRYRQELDQRLCVAVYKLLLRALRTEYGINQQPRFIYNDKGKPFLEGFPEIHFSLSHCPQAVACAVSDSPVGIDVETTDNYSVELARQVMSDNEMRLIHSSSCPDVTFTRLWTMKESLYKLQGGGHPDDIPHLLDNTNGCRFTTLVLDNSVMTVCESAIRSGDSCSMKR